MSPESRAPRRVVHVVNRLASTGDGISNVCVDLACQQVAEGDVVMVATTRGGYTDLVQEHGVIVTEMDFRLRSVRGLAQAVRELRSLLSQFGPDVVHAHTVLATVVARLAVTGMPTGVVATVHNEYQRGVILKAAACASA